MSTTLAPAPPVTSVLPSIGLSRIQSIDLLRGLVMVIMTLDHVRDFFHVGAQLSDPMDMNTTTPALFLTRWITHFCAPTFVFLSGISAYLSGSKNKSKAELTLFLFTRGLWLILLEVTIVTFGWTFDIQFRSMLMQVIWAIGLSMVILSVLIHLPRYFILLVGLLLVVGHNLLDPIALKSQNWEDYVWAGLHQFRFFQVSPNFNLIVAYPVMPWLGLMVLGYYFGRFYRPDFDSKQRRKILLYTGLTCFILFLAFRLINAYGDAQGFETQKTVLQSFYDFLNTTKYPPSLHYSLMTIGPALLALLAFEKARNKVADFFITIGKVPLFYYLLHIYLIHGLAILAAFASGFSWKDFDPTSFIGMPKGYGFSLPVVYLAWIVVVLILYPLCRWYGGYKARHRDNKLLSYL